MSMLASIFTGKKIEVPKVIEDTFVEGEKALYAVQQARLKQLVTPDSIFVTNKRVIVHRPALFGFRRNIEDYKYADMANTIINQGIISSTIAIKIRFLSDNVKLEGIPNKVARDIFGTIQNGIAGQLEAGAPATPAAATVTAAAASDMAPVPTAIGASEEAGGQDTVELLKRRYVMGEITKRQYGAMMKDLLHGTEPPAEPKRQKAAKRRKSKNKA